MREKAEAASQSGERRQVLEVVYSARSPNANIVFLLLCKNHCFRGLSGENLFTCNDMSLHRLLLRQQQMLDSASR